MLRGSIHPLSLSKGSAFLENGVNATTYYSLLLLLLLLLHVVTVILATLVYTVTYGPGTLGHCLAWVSYPWDVTGGPVHPEHFLLREGRVAAYHPLS